MHLFLSLAAAAVALMSCSGECPSEIPFEVMYVSDAETLIVETIDEGWRAPNDTAATTAIVVRGKYE